MKNMLKIPLVFGLTMVSLAAALISGVCVAVLQEIDDGPTGPDGDGLL